MPARVSIIIVNYNGARLLPECLEAVRTQTAAVAETIVVDNGSSDGSIDLLRSEFPWVRLDAAGENLFFCRGANRGLLASSGEFALLLNNDCILAPTFIERGLEVIRRDERIGAVCGRIMRVGGEVIDQAGQTVARSRKPLDRGYGDPDEGQYDAEEDVPSAGGVAPLMRRAMLDDVAFAGQFFDEDFVQYYEDLDLFWRAANLGWKCRYAPGATARHYRGASGQSEPATQSWLQRFAFANLSRELQGHVLKNRWATIAKNDRLGRFLLNLPWFLAYELKVLAYMTLVKPSLFPLWFHAFGFLRTAMRKRRVIKRMARDRGIRRFVSV